MPRHRSSAAKHIWLPNEEDALLCLLTRNVHIIGKVKDSDLTAKSLREARRARQRQPRVPQGSLGVPQAKAYMDTAEALNDNLRVGSKNFENISVQDVSDLPEVIDECLVFTMCSVAHRGQVCDKITSWYEEKPRAMALLERTSRGRITRAIRLAFGRGRCTTSHESVQDSIEQDQQDHDHNCTMAWDGTIVPAVHGNDVQPDDAWGLDQDPVQQASAPCSSLTTPGETLDDDPWANANTIAAPIARFDDAINAWDPAPAVEIHSSSHVNAEPWNASFAHIGPSASVRPGSELPGFSDSSSNLYNDPWAEICSAVESSARLDQPVALRHPVPSTETQSAVEQAFQPPCASSITMPPSLDAWELSLPSASVATAVKSSPDPWAVLQNCPSAGADAEQQRVTWGSDKDSMAH